MYFDHPERLARKCKHIIHPSSSAHTPWCPQCVISAAQAGIEKAEKRLEAEGGVDAPRYMRDRAWNVARLQQIAAIKRVEKTKKGDQLRHEREEVWESTHQQYVAQYGLFPPGPLLHSACVVCTAMKEPYQLDEKQATTSRMVWWEQQGALVADRTNILPRSTMDIKHPRQPKAKCPSYLREFIQSCRKATTVSEVHRRAWEERCKTERAVRRKYDLPDDFDIDPEFFANPISASHARHHHRQIKDGQQAAERRANRYKRRTEGYRHSRSSLALSELAGDVDNTNVEALKSVEAEAELQHLASVEASEVGYLYFVGDVDGFEDWMDDVEQSNMCLVYRKSETDEKESEDM
ncbi:hypothetical protein EKO04_009077 [Ascochyta lentis]|uniref:Uncharacterized protein n=1 Tax=Ascochyta lentis TaxID=205686 RepID=A0A8H7ME07_9PLEO|nr:hypothetical protein EKO04_009077 [Ascochyta lentis]